MRTLTLATALAVAIALRQLLRTSKVPVAGTGAAATERGAGLALTAQEAQAWIGKPVYSSDGKMLGKVSSLERSADNKVTELHADIGGFLGLGQHHVRLVPAQIKLLSDRVVLDVTSAQAKELPEISK